MTSIYEEQFKVYIMQGMSSGKTKDLKSYLQQLIDENKEAYAEINFAYLKVKKELLG